MPNASFGVDISSFNKGISTAKQEVRTLDQQMKMLNATIKAEGASEATLNQQTQTLNSKLAAQKSMAKQAEDALKAMTEKGVKPTSDAYQKMARELLAAQTGMMETKAALNELGEGSLKAADGVEKLESGLSGISRKISLDQVISGVGKITDGLESAARKAVKLGETIWTNVMDSATWGDDIATQAMMAQMSVEEYQRIVNVAAKNGETSTGSMIKSWKKVKMNLTSDSKDVVSAFNELNVKTKEWGDAGQSGPSLIARDYMDVYWEIGEALLKVSDASKQERLAQTLLGRSWQESLPMFLMGRKAYEEALRNEDVLTGEQVNNLGTLNDTVTGVNQKFETLKNTLIAEIAPTLTDVAGSIGDILHEINAYLETEEGQQTLKDMGDAIGRLFEGLGQLNAEDVVSGFKNVFDKIVNGLQWLADNGGKVISIVEGLGIAWAGLKLGSGALDILKLLNGLKGLTGMDATGAESGGGGTVWSTLGSSLMGFAGKAAPILSNAALQNGLPGVYDWLMNQTDVGMWLRGTKTPGDTWNDLKQNVQNNAETFESDWRNNVLMKPFFDLGENNIRFWDQFWNKDWKKAQENLGAAAEWTLGDEFTADELMQMINNGEPVPIKSDIDMETSAEDIAEQIGTVIIPGVVQVTGDPTYSKRTPGMQGIIPGYANGIAYVPDTRLAILHRGETVTPAREIASRNYSSNLYVEKMIMGGGTDARGLADEMAAAQRRQASGYGG